MNEIDNPYYRAAYSKFVAEQDEAVANLLTLFNRPVGIGEHTDFMVEINKWVEQGSAAVDKIQFLANVFGQGYHQIFCFVCICILNFSSSGKQNSRSKG